MDPKDRSSTLVKTKVSSVREQATSDEISAGAQYEVPEDELQLHMEGGC